MVLTEILNTVGLAANVAAACILARKVVRRKPSQDWADAVREAYPTLPQTPALQQDQPGYDSGANPAQSKFDERRSEHGRELLSLRLVVFGALCNGVATWIGHVGGIIPRL